MNVEKALTKLFLSFKELDNRVKMLEQGGGGREPRVGSAASDAALFDVQEDGESSKPDDMH